MREIKVGDNVWLRDDLVEGEWYGVSCWQKSMRKGTIEKIMFLEKERLAFVIKGGNGFGYTYEMIDWDKTEKMWEEQQVKTDEKLVMPKFFDDWFKRCEDIELEKNECVELICSQYESRTLSEEMKCFYRENKEKCYRAILDGYEVEEEPVKLYTVDCGGGVKLVKRNNEVYLTIDNIHTEYTYKLTQSEIENSEHSVLMAIAKEVK